MAVTTHAEEVPSQPHGVQRVDGQRRLEGGRQRADELHHHAYVLRFEDLHQVR